MSKFSVTSSDIRLANRSYVSPGNEFELNDKQVEKESKKLAELKDCKAQSIEIPRWSEITDSVDKYWYSYAAMQQVSCAIRDFISFTGNASASNYFIRNKLDPMKRIAVVSSTGLL